jgi:hypothetical protein
MTNSEFFSLIFLPGFSSADEVSGLFGHGVGTDVVRRSTEQPLSICYELGAKKENIGINVAGGASIKRNDDDSFKIGKRNFTTLRKLLWKNGFMIKTQDVGGNISRTMALRVSDGFVTVNKQPIGTAPAMAPG